MIREPASRISKPIPEKTCPACGITRPLDAFNLNRSRLDGVQAQCRSCQHATEQKHSRSARGAEARKRNESAKYARRKVLFADKLQARSKAKQAILSGKLSKLPCVACGDPKSEAHHEDYGKPLDVIWLCRTHHNEHHRIQRRRA